MCIAALNCIDANGDIRVLRASHRNGAIKIAAEGELSDQRLILLALVCKFLMGALAMTSLPGREPDGDPSLGSTFIPILMITVAISLVYLSISKKLRRRQIDGYLRAEEDRATTQLATESTQRHVEITDSLDALHHEVTDNTKLTEHAAEQATAAYHEANSVNAWREEITQRIEETTEAGKVASEAGNRIMVDMGATGEDTLTRVKRVEAATVDVKVTLTDRSDETNKRLDKLEEAADQKHDDPDT